MCLQLHKKSNLRMDSGSGETTAEDTITVAWVLLPILFLSSFYCILAMFTWPYARPIVPLWLLLFVLLIPPLFPFLLFYLFFMFLFYPPYPSSRVYLVSRGPIATTNLPPPPSSSTATIVVRGNSAGGGFRGSSRV